MIPARFRYSTDLLKIILINLPAPERLDNHPWTKSLLVREACSREPRLRGQPPGTQLVAAISDIFRRMLPSVPPRRGLRLDTRWGEFGLIAARYFAPYLYGLPYPSSLREAWQCIDGALMLFLFNGNEGVKQEERDQYYLVANESVVAPDSTISDWHRKGIEALAEFVIQEEKRLEVQQGVPSAETEVPVSSVRSGQHPLWAWPLWRWIGRISLILLLALFVLAGWKGWQIFQILRSAQEHAEALQSLSTSLPRQGQLEEAGKHLSDLRSDMQSLQKQAEPWMVIAPYLDWVPVYGGDLSQAPRLLELGVQLSAAGDEAFQAVSPLLPAILEDRDSGQILKLLSQLHDADAQLLAAQVALARARAARQQIQAERLSTQVHDLVLGKIDPLLLSLEGSFPVDDILLMARLSPRLLGAVGNGPQTYLILLQNEDELRPTGGFLTAVGILELQNGEIVNLTFEDSYLVDDLSKPYPRAPWQLDEYMRADILLLRDANWFTNFPTTVEWAKFLYGYSRPASIDGVIAIDQHVLVEVLRIVGPVKVAGEDELITAENVLAYMRLAEEPAPKGVDRSTWDRKQFIDRMAAPLVERLLAGDGYSSTDLVRKVLRWIEEKHILLQSDDPEMKVLLAGRGWDGSVQPAPKSDFLMIVDTSIGFNKTHALIENSLIYEIDLRDRSHPLAHLRVTYVNNAQGESTCIQRPANTGAERQIYEINDCYWTYLRIYVPSETDLIASTPRAVPADRTLLGEPVPARTDRLGNEDIPGVEVFGTLVVVPMDETLSTDFHLGLPANVIQQVSQDGSWSYHLTVQKQPGTIAVPITLSFLLPQGMEVISASHELQHAQEVWTLHIDLRTDLEFEIVFAPIE